MTKMLCAALLVLSGCSSSTPARPIGTVYPVNELSEDLAQLRSVLVEGHPALYKYRTRAAVDSIFRALQDSAGRPMTAVDLWRLASIAVAGIRDNHTSVVPNQPMFTAIYRDPGAVLPLRLAVIGDRLYVARSYLATDSVQDGSEILSLNGVDGDRFIRDCMKVVPTDGDVALRAVRKIERDFELTCSLMGGLPSEYRITIRAPDGETKTVAIATRPWRDVSKARRDLAPLDTIVPPDGSLTFTSDSLVATLGVRTFSKTDTFDPGQFIRESLERLRKSKARSLVIDLRGNTGGTDKHAARLYAGIAADTFTYYATRKVNKGRYRFLKKTDDWMLNYMIWFIPKKRLADGGYRLRLGMDKPMQPSVGAWKKPVFMLVDGNSVSTSSELASVFRSKQRGVIIGEESGSALGGGTGATVSYVLPNTQLSLNLPLMTAWIRPASGSTESLSRGVIPDIVVNRSLQDLLDGRDVAGERAMTLARAAAR